MDKWKVLSIIAVVLLVLSWSLFGLLMYNGSKIYEKENECSFNICNKEAYDSYFYNAYEDVCYCLDDNDIKYFEYMG